MPDKKPALPTIPKFLLTIWTDWGARVSGIFSVPFTYLAAVSTTAHTKTIYAVLAITGVLATIYQVWAGERRALVNSCDEIEVLRGKIQQLPGPELRLAYDTSQGGMLNWPLAIQNLKGGNAYRVAIEGLEYGSFVANLAEVHIIADGQICYPQSTDTSHRYCHLLAALAGKDEVKFPVAVRCEDSSNRTLVHYFEFHYREKSIPSFRPLRRKVI